MKNASTVTLCANLAAGLFTKSLSLSKRSRLIAVTIGLLGSHVFISAPAIGQNTKSPKQKSISIQSPKTKVALNVAKKPKVEARKTVGQFSGRWYVTPNFQVHAADPRMAKEVGEQAEVYRRKLAIQWTGKELARWQTRCPIQVVVNGHAQGETSFLLPSSGTGLPSDWDMKIYGPPNRILDSVLPHEITHTVFATYFGRRLPRWADEGACTTVEHPAEKRKIQSMLLRFLSPQQRKGIPFNHMFRMREYPTEMLPLYAQGYSVARFLIAQGGHQQFVQFLGTGMNNEGAMGVLPSWNHAINRFYGYQDLSDLQLKWLRWVQDGSNEKVAHKFSNRKNLAAEPQVRLASADLPGKRPSAMGARNPGHAAVGVNPSSGFDRNFYVKKMQQGARKSSPSSGGTSQKTAFQQKELLSSGKSSLPRNPLASIQRIGQVHPTKGIADGAISRIPGRENLSPIPSSNGPSGKKLTSPKSNTRYAKNTDSKSKANNRLDSTISIQR